MKKKVRLILALALAGVFLLAAPLGAVLFSYENLGNLGHPQYNGNEAYGINDAGQVVGEAYTDYGTAPFVKSPGQAMQALPSTNQQGEANAINSSGFIVGWWANAGERNACQWTKPFLHYIKTDLGFLGGIASQALAINQDGQDTTYEQILGFVKAQGDVTMHPLDPLPTHTSSFAAGINTSGVICGWSSKPGEQEACIWVYHPGGGYIPIGLGTFTYDPYEGQANGLNDYRRVVGFSRSHIATRHAFLCDASGSVPGPLQDLGLLPGGIDSEAKAINNNGWVVGTASTDLDSTPAGQRAFLWTSGGKMQDLGSLVKDLPPGVHLMSANALNKHGEIVGKAVNFDTYEAIIYRLKPLTACPYAALLLD